MKRLLKQTAKLQMSLLPDSDTSSDSDPDVETAQLITRQITANNEKFLAYIQRKRDRKAAAKTTLKGMYL